MSIMLESAWWAMSVSFPGNSLFLRKENRYGPPKQVRRDLFRAPAAGRAVRRAPSLHPRTNPLPVLAVITVTPPAAPQSNRIYRKDVTRAHAEIPKASTVVVDCTKFPSLACIFVAKRLKEYGYLEVALLNKGSFATPRCRE